LRDVVEALLRAWAAVNEVAVTTSFYLASVYADRNTGIRMLSERT
jgi:hypothetical protein